MAQLTLIFFSVLWLSLAEANEPSPKKVLSLSCAYGAESIEACRLKFQKRVYMARRFQDHYDPRMKAMLASTAIGAQTIAHLKALQDKPEHMKRFFIEMTKWGNRQQLHLKSINTEELSNYALTVAGTLLEEGVDLAAAELQLLPPTTAIGIVARIAPAAIDVAKVMVNEFPKISVANPKSIQESDREKAEAFALLSGIQETGNFDMSDSDIMDVLDTGVGTFLKEGANIDEQKLAADPEAQQVAAMSSFLRYSNEELIVEVKRSEARLGTVVHDAAEKTHGIIKNTHQYLKKSVASLESRQQALINGQQDLLTGQEQLKYGQSHIIEGVDYLAYRELQRDQQEQLARLSVKELENFIADAEACAVAMKQSPQGVKHFKPESLAQKKCAVQKGMVGEAQRRIRQQETQLSINIAQQTIGTISNLGVIFKDKNLQKLGHDASKVMEALDKARKAMDAFEKLSQSASLLSNMSGFMTGVGALTSAMSLFAGSSGPSMDEIILEQLMEIRKSIADLHKDMIEQFNLVNSKLDQLATQLNDSLLAHGRVVNSNLAVLYTQGDQNSQAILDRLDMLNLVTVNLDKYFKQANQTDIVDLSGQFFLSKKPEDLFVSFRNLLTRYSALLEEVDPNSISAYQADLGFDPEGQIKNYESILKFSSAQKMSPYGRAILLSSLIELNQEIAEECGPGVFEKVLFANVISSRFLEHLNKTQNYNGQEVFKIDLALGDKSLTDIDAFSQTLEKVLSILHSLQAKARACVGQGHEQYKYVRELFNFVQGKLVEHSEEVAARLTAQNGELQTKIINEIRQNTNDNFGINGAKDILNGLTIGRRQGLNANFVINADSGDKLDQPEFASQQFTAATFAPLGRCITPPSSATINPLVRTVPFPKAAINQLIKNNYLKLALASGLIQWDWCFEVGVPPAGADDLLSAYVMAYETSKGEDLKDQTQVKALWKLIFKISPDQQQQALHSYEKRVLDQTHHWRSFFNDVPGKTRMWLDSWETHLDQTTLTNSCVEGSEKIGTDIEEPDRSARRRKKTTCKQLTDIFAGIWKSQAVDSAEVVATTKAHFPQEVMVAEGTLAVHLPIGELKKLAEKDFDQAMAEFLPPAAGKTVADLDPLLMTVAEPLSASQQENYHQRLSAALSGYYQLVRNAFESCYFAALKGHSQCVPISSAYLLEKPKDRDLKQLIYTSDLLAKLPDVLYRKKAIYLANGVEQQLADSMGEIISPAHIFDLAELLYNSGAVDAPATAQVSQLIAQNEKQFNEVVMPFLEQNYEFDDSLLVDERSIFDIEQLLNSVLKAK